MQSRMRKDNFMLSKLMRNFNVRYKQLLKISLQRNKFLDNLNFEFQFRKIDLSIYSRFKYLFNQEFNPLTLFIQVK